LKLNRIADWRNEILTGNNHEVGDSNKKRADRFIGTAELTEPIVGEPEVYRTGERKAVNRRGLLLADLEDDRPA